MAPKPKTSEILFPSGGVARRLAYQQQQPYTCQDAANVWPFDPLEGRERGGSRPGTSKAFATDLGGPIQGLGSVTIVNSNATISNVLAAMVDGMVWYNAAGTMTALYGGKNLVVNPGFETFTGTADDATSDTFTSWTNYVPDAGDKALAITGGRTGTAGTYSLKIIRGAGAARPYVKTNNQRIATAAGTICQLSFWTKGDGTGQGRYAVYAQGAGSYAKAVTQTGVSAATWTEVTTTFTVPASTTYLELYLYGCDNNTESCFFDDVVLKVKNPLNATADTLLATPHHQKLYIGDYRATRLYGTDGVIASGNQLSAASISDWTAQSIDITRDVVLLVDPDAATTAEDDVYEITAVAAGYLTLDPAPNDTGPGSDLTPGSGWIWEIGRKIQVYDPSTGEIDPLEATYGIPPINCPLICTYRDRIVACQSNIWYMSRAGDATDWDFGYTPEDPLRPMAATITDAAGYVADPILCVIPHSDDYLIFGAERSIYLMRGDPGGGGQIDTVSREIGIISATAWAKLPDSSIVFLSRLGLYVMSAGAGAPEPWSPQVLPQSLRDVDVTAKTVSMAYDGLNRGVHLFITPTAGTVGEHYFLSVETRGIFPVTLPNAQQPTCLVTYAADQGDPAYVLMGCYDGYVRRYDSSVATDDGTAITSYVTIGPLRLAGPGDEGMITELGCTLDEDSADVTWELMVGDSAEAAVDNATADYSGTWTAGWNGITAPRVRGQAAKLKLSGTDDWAMESIPITVAHAGRQR